jgi:glucose 1-dehydrogenase
MVSSAARPLQDQKTLVTGGSSGIGAATARAFARAGAAVGVNYRSKASAAEELVREIRDQGGEAIALKADVSRDDEVRAMFDWLVEACSRTSTFSSRTRGSRRTPRSRT